MALHTSQLAFIVLGSIALERIINELLFKISSPGYVPGKFKSCTAGCPEWLERRRRFLVPYALTWVVVLSLWLAPHWPAVRADGSPRLVTGAAVLVAALVLVILHERDLRVSRS